MAKSSPRSPFPSVLDILVETSSLCALEKVTTPATRPKLPYRVPDELLPAPLPSVAEILAAPKVGSHREGDVPIYRVGEHFAVKYSPTDVHAGYDVSLQEGENMLFVQQSTNMPVPKLYAMFYMRELA